MTSTHGTRINDETIDAARYMRLGWREQGTELFLEDYCHYERRVRNLLRDERIARVAIMSGGILLRLAIEILGLEEALDIILDGPSDYSSRPVFCTECDDQVTEWWDDTMTEEERDLICGTYKMYLSKSVSS